MQATRSLHPACIAAALSISLIGSGSALADVLYVPEQFETIQSAINAASAGDTVLVADGVYTGKGNRDLDLLGKAITLKSENGPEHTVIEAQGTPTDPHRGFMLHSDETSSTIIDGFTVSGGATPEGAIQNEFNGGGFLLANSSPTIQNCIISNNSCGCWGAGISLGLFGLSSPTIINCLIIDNHADDDGGGLFTVSDTPLTIINSVIAGNSTRGTGGGIAGWGNGEITLINTTVVGNSARQGAGLLIVRGNISNSIIRDNIGSQQVWETRGFAVSYSNVQGGFAGEGNIDSEVQFADAASHNYRLTSRSGGIDAGDNDAAATSQYDMAGQPRFLDDASMANTGNGSGPLVDMGAFEFTPLAATPARIDAVEVAFGFHRGGAVSQVMVSDDDYFRSQSGFRFAGNQPHRVVIRVEASTEVSFPATLSVVTEAALNGLGGKATLRLLNVTTGEFDDITTYGQSAAELVRGVVSLDAKKYVNPVGGRIELLIEHTALATLTASGFPSSIDLVTISVAE